MDLTTVAFVTAAAAEPTNLQSVLQGACRTRINCIPSRDTHCGSESMGICKPLRV